MAVGNIFVFEADNADFKVSSAALSLHWIRVHRHDRLLLTSGKNWKCIDKEHRCWYLLIKQNDGNHGLQSLDH